jgi:hypothetical protein
MNTVLHPAPLAFLSLQHVPPGVVPEAYSNEERRRAFEEAQPKSLHNAYSWPHLSASAKEQHA